MGVYSTEELEEIRTTSLAGLGVILMDKLDQVLADQAPEDIDDAYKTIGCEVVRRSLNAAKLESLMDFHYDKWKKNLKAADLPSQERLDAFYEFKAMMAGFTEIHSDEEGDEES